MPFFSVIVPNYNHSRYLKERFDSILNQTFKDFELIIVDDCSTDSSRDIIESYRGNEKLAHILYYEKNTGSPFKPWKSGIQVSRGDYIWIAESDDFSHPEFLSVAYEAILKFPDTGVYFCNSFQVNAVGEKMKETIAMLNNRRYPTDKWNRDYYATGTDEINGFLQFDFVPYNVSAVVFKKQLFEPAARELEAFRYVGDWFFFLKSALTGNVYYSSTALNYFRRHNASHFHKREDLVSLKSEYFRILRLLYHSDKIKDKTLLLDHFAFYHLSFGLIEDGPAKGLFILKSYFRLDRALALKVTFRIFSIKLFRKGRPNHYSFNNH